jgi:hypothetical protein
VSLNAFPAKEMQFAIGPDGLDYVVGYAVATLAASDCWLFGHIGFIDYESLSRAIQDSAIGQLTIDDARGAGERMFVSSSTTDNVKHGNALRF